MVGNRQDHQRCHLIIEAIRERYQRVAVHVKRAREGFFLCVLAVATALACRQMNMPPVILLWIWTLTGSGTLACLSRFWRLFTMKLLSQYPKEVKAFLVASLVASAGGSLMWPLTTMYVFDELNRSMQDAGLVILIQSLGGIIGQLLGGALYHKVGVKD